MIQSQVNCLGAPGERKHGGGRLRRVLAFGVVPLVIVAGLTYALGLTLAYILIAFFCVTWGRRHREGRITDSESV
jgi:hypothetical protein